jgi:RNA polymerase sigma-70 factor, ECF subfamily
MVVAMAGTRPGSTTLEQQLIEAARGGDQQAYQRLLEPYRPSLHAHAYRMLGSVQDAEDAMQEALLGAWQGLSRFEGRSALRTWFFTIVTNACIRLAARRPGRRLPADQSAPSDPRQEIPPPLERITWVEPYPDERMGLLDGPPSPQARYEQLESVELAFVAALQHLPPIQRAVLILRDVLGFSAQEAATALETSVPSANSALQRARAALEQRLPAASQQATRRTLGDLGQQQLVERFLAAWQRADVEAIVALLASDATFEMPPLPLWLRGREDIQTFLTERVFALRWRFMPARANGQPAMAAYQWSAVSSSFRLDVLNVLSLSERGVSAITAFLGPELLSGFGLPGELPA